MEPLKLPPKVDIHNASEQGEEAVTGLLYTTFQKMAERIQQLEDRLAKKAVTAGNRLQATDWQRSPKA